MAGTRKLLRPGFCDNPSCLYRRTVVLQWQCCAPADPQANDDADFKNGPPPRKKLKVTLGKGKKKVAVERRFSTCSASELETACKV